MAIYQHGSRGAEVLQIQERLQALGLYRGAIDGIYGNGTESAVKAFQRAEAIAVDGIVGPTTWAHLFEGAEIAPPAILGEPLAFRTLALTGSFETGAPPPRCFSGLSGDFDGQGISFGALQWNFGQGSLQPLLNTMNDKHSEVMQAVFGQHLGTLQNVLVSPWDEQMTWARSVQDLDSFVLHEPWDSVFKKLGSQKAYQQIQVDTARGLYDAAVNLARGYGLGSERAIALMFDIKVQNGSISDLTEQQIRDDFDALPETEGETARLCIIANRRSEASNPRWVEDVRSRKLTIATGRGKVHGIHYVLDEAYGIDLESAF